MSGNKLNSEIFKSLRLDSFSVKWKSYLSSVAVVPAKNCPSVSLSTGSDTPSAVII